MRKYLKRSLAVLLTLLTALTALPGLAAAQETSDDPASADSAVYEEENGSDSAGGAENTGREDPAEAAGPDEIRALDAAEEPAEPAAEAEPEPDPEPVPEPYTGFVLENGAWQYYVDDVKSDLNSVVSGTVNGTGGMWYVLNGKAQLDFTGLCDYADEAGRWWYVKNGLVDTGRNSVEQNGYGWWYVAGGRVDFGYTGVSDYGNDYGYWYIKNGKVDFSCNSVEQNRYGWWYVTGGKVRFGYTGVADYANAYGWWYIKDGRVDFSKNSVEQNSYGWWYVLGGKVDFGYTGVADYGNDYGWWYIKNGKVDFSKNSVEPNRYGWWYVTGGRVRFGYTGVADYANAYGWWYVKDGKVDFSKNSVESNSYGWWYVLGGKVNFSYTGVCDYENTYGWWYVRGGKVDFGFTGGAENRYGMWYVKGGKVDFGTNGTVTRLGIRYNVSSGKVLSTHELTSAERLKIINDGKNTVYASSLVYLANTVPEAIDYVYLYPELYPIRYTEDYDLTAEAHQDTVPLLMQWDMRWGYVSYGGSCLGRTGCGALSLSMAALYLLHDPTMTPTFIASYVMQNGYYETGVGTSRTLFDYGCTALGLNSEYMAQPSEKAMKDALDRGCLIIATMGPGIFTTGGHVIVFTGYTNKGFTVNDPNSVTRSATIYSFDEFGDQIKFMWALSAA